MKTPRTLAELRADPRVEEVWQEHDGCFHHTRPSYWLALAPGWVNYDDCTSLHEATVKDLCGKLSLVSRREATERRG